MDIEDSFSLDRHLRGNDVSELLGDGFEFSIDNMPEDESETQDYEYSYDEYRELVNRDCVAVSADDLHVAGVPFAELAEKMTNVTPDGKVKKRMVTAGVEEIQENALVDAHYSFFLENSHMPFDSTYLRIGKPAKFVLGRSGNLAGFDVAVMSMKVKERAQFIVHYDLAFREMGSPPRIPRCANILMEIHILKAVDCGDTIDDSATEPQTYEDVIKLALQYQQNAKDMFVQGLIPSAVHNYLLSEKILLRGNSGFHENEEEEEEEKYKDLLLKVYTNLAVCYNHPKKKDAKRVLQMFEKAHAVDESATLKSAKLLYNRGIAYSALCDYDSAIKDLSDAWSLEPNNADINKKLKEVNDLKKKSLADEKDFVARAFGVPRVLNEKKDHLELKANFKEEATEVLEDFAQGNESSLVLPPNYTKEERLFFDSECSRLGLVYEERTMANKLLRILIKKY